MRAVALLGPLDTPQLRVRLLPVRPEDVDVRPLPWWLKLVSPTWVTAITLPWAVYVRVEALEGDPELLPRLIAHELVHVRQWRTAGPLGFLRRYLADYLRGRRQRLGHRAAYRAITLESEATDIANQASTPFSRTESAL